MTVTLSTRSATETWLHLPSDERTKANSCLCDRVITLAPNTSNKADFISMANEAFGWEQAHIPGNQNKL